MPHTSLIEGIFSRYQLAGKETDQLAGFLCASAAETFALDLTALFDAKTHEACKARMVCYHILHREEGLSPERIARHFGQRSKWAIRKAVRQMSQTLSNSRYNRHLVEHHGRILKRFQDFKTQQQNAKS
jgi:hypothetical protein